MEQTLPAVEAPAEATVRPAVDEAVRLAEKMMRDSWHTGLASAWLPTRDALRAHLSAALDAATVDERERCAKLADEYATWGGSAFAKWFRKLAAEIRA